MTNKVTTDDLLKLEIYSLECERTTPDAIKLDIFYQETDADKNRVVVKMIKAFPRLEQEILRIVREYFPELSINQLFNFM